MTMRGERTVASNKVLELRSSIYSKYNSDRACKDIKLLSSEIKFNHKQNKRAEHKCFKNAHGVTVDELVAIFLHHQSPNEQL